MPSAPGQNQEDRDKRRRLRRNPPNLLGQEQQHFLLTAGAVTMTEAQVARLSEAEAYEVFKTIRFAETGGAPSCPHPDCGHTRVYTLNTARRARASREGFVEPVFKCAACRRQFTVTSGRLFASRKMSFRDILYSLMVFANAVSGEAALRLRRAVGCSYKTAFVQEHKVREAIQLSRSDRPMFGVVEVDGKEIGGHHRKATLKKDQRDYRRTARNKQVVVAVRERGEGGESRVVIRRHESDGYDFVRNTIKDGSLIVSDEGWSLSELGEHLRVKHKEGYMIDGVSSNIVESLFARIQRAEEGVHYRITGIYLDLYAQEISWREDYRRRSTGDLWRMLLAATASAPVSKRMCGYWQRWQATDIKRRRRDVWTKPKP